MLAIYSNKSTAVFLTDTVKFFKADSDAIDSFELDNSVQALVTKINARGGFRVVGWFKPALDEDGTTIEHKRFHVCSLFPEKPLTDEEKLLKYQGETAATVTALWIQGNHQKPSIQSQSSFFWTVSTVIATVNLVIRYSKLLNGSF